MWGEVSGGPMSCTRLSHLRDSVLRSPVRGSGLTPGQSTKTGSEEEREREKERKKEKEREREGGREAGREGGRKEGK